MTGAGDDLLVNTLWTWAEAYPNDDRMQKLVAAIVTRFERDAASIAELQARVEKLRATSIGAGVCYECDRVWSLGYPHEEHERDCPARPL